MYEKADWMGLDLSNKSDAFIFAMLYERWSGVPSTSIRFSVQREDVNFGSRQKSQFFISNIDINKTTQ